MPRTPRRSPRRNTGLAVTMALAAALPGACVRYTIVSDGITRAAIGETAEIGAVKIRPIEVVEDSRCPAGDQCIWAGQVRLRAQVIDADGVADRIFVMPGADAEGGAPAGTDAQVVLAEVSPEPEPRRRLYPEEYRFGFRPATGAAGQR